MKELARHIQSQGRGKDSVLIHMTPGEVGGLQALAKAHGGSLTINPKTGLPEAGFLDTLLPILAGVAGSFVGIPPWITAAGVGALTGAVKNDLGAGLMAGLGAFGGAGLGAAMAAPAAASAALPGAIAAPTALGANAGVAGIGTAADLTPAAMAGNLGAAPITVSNAGAYVPGATLAAPTASAAPPSALSVAKDSWELAGNAPAYTPPPPDAGVSSFTSQPWTFDRAGDHLGKQFSDITSGNASTGTYAGLAGLALPLLGGLGGQGGFKEPKPEKSTYDGPYRPTTRAVSYPDALRRATDSSEWSYFSPFNPSPGFEKAAKGGSIGDWHLHQGDPGGGGGGGGGYAGPGPMVSPPAAGLPGSNVVTGPVVMPTAGYRPGQDPEHNYNFRPVGGMVPPAAAGASGGRGAFGSLGILGPIFALADRVLIPKGGSSSSSSSPVPMNYKYNPATQSIVRMATGGLTALNRGGVPLHNGSFVVDARTVSEIGNGSSGAGQEALARLGGVPIHGPGDGVSDSIHANIGGVQRAKVARDEVKFDPDAVRRLGKGSHKKGSDKLYALMERAKKARASAKRGENTGLAALVGR